MHVHRAKRKGSTNEDYVQLQKEKARNDNIGLLYRSLFERRNRKDYSNEALDETAELLEKVPEAYTMYNFRREILYNLWATSNDTSWSEHNDDVCSPCKSQLVWLKEELEFNSRALFKNYKNYAAFSHRHWIIETLQTMARSENVNMHRRDVADTARPVSAFLASTLSEELTQCNLLLRLDERNFHVWNHRRWVREQLSYAYAHTPDFGASTHCSFDAVDLFPMTTTLQRAIDEERDERELTTSCINKNFSNYSAWHQRGVLIQTAMTRAHELLLVCDKDNSNDTNLVDDTVLPCPCKQSAACDVDARYRGRNSTTSNCSSDNDGHNSQARSKPVPECVCSSLQTSPLPNTNLAEFHKDIHGEVPRDKLLSMMTMLKSYLGEDLTLLTKAIYCDPNDQAAWFYAPFVIRTVEKLNFLFTYANHDSGLDLFGCSCCQTDENQIDAFVCATIELLVEEKRLGGEDCYLPMFFLLFVLSLLTSGIRNPSARCFVPPHTYHCHTEKNIYKNLHPLKPEEDSGLEYTKKNTIGVAPDNTFESISTQRTERYVALFYNSMHNTSGERTGSVTSNTTEDETRCHVSKADLMSWTFSFLHHHLVKADKLRAGLYDYLISHLL